MESCINDSIELVSLASSGFTSWEDPINYQSSSQVIESSQSIHNTWNTSNTSPSLGSSETNELKLETEDLKLRHKRQGNELLNITYQLDEVEQRNLTLEVQLQDLHESFRSEKEKLRNRIESLQDTLDKQNTNLQETNSELQDKSNRLYKLLKELRIIEEDKNALQQELQKACSELQWYHQQNMELRSILQKSEEIFNEQLQEIKIRLDGEKNQLLFEIHKLTVSFSKVEDERNELLENLNSVHHNNPSHSHPIQETISSKMEDLTDESEYEEEEGSKLNSESPFPNTKSILTEIEESLESKGQRSSSLRDIYTQTDDISIGLNYTFPRDINLLQHYFNNKIWPQLQEIQDQTEQEPAKADSYWRMLQPIDDRRQALVMGVIPDEDKERMRQYAYDVPLRSSHADAAILSRREWRTLRRDLENLEMSKYKKRFGREEDKDERSCYKPMVALDDVDELAETYCEQFPFLAENIFQYLDSITEVPPSFEDLPYLKTRFEELACAFRSDHQILDRRHEMVQMEYRNSKESLSQLSSVLKQNTTDLKSLRMGEGVKELFGRVELATMQIDNSIDKLDRTAKKLGRLDMSERIMKMIEVMVIYVRTLRTVCADLDDEKRLAIELLSKNGIQFAKKKNGPESETAKQTSATATSNSNIEHNDILELIDDEKEMSQSAKYFSTLCVPQNAKKDHLLHKLLRLKSNNTTDIKTSADGLLRPYARYRPHLKLFSSGKWDSIQREFHWPWDREKTWEGIRRIFATLLMLFGLLIVLRVT